MNNSTQPVLTIIKLVLLCTTCVLGYALWSELNTPIALPVNTDIDSKAVIKNDIPLEKIQYEVPEISDYDEIINRPLFFEDRKPYVYVAPETPTKKPRKKKQAAPKKTEQYSLNAVVITSERQLAIIQSGRKKTLQRIALGEEIDGWTLETIEPRSVLLKKGNESKNLELEIRTSKPQQKSTTKTSKTTPKEEISQKAEKTPQIPAAKSMTPGR